MFVCILPQFLQVSGLMGSGIKTCVKVDCCGSDEVFGYFEWQTFAVLPLSELWKCCYYWSTMILYKYILLQNWWCYKLIMKGKEREFLSDDNRT